MTTQKITTSKLKTIKQDDLSTLSSNFTKITGMSEIDYEIVTAKIPAYKDAITKTIKLMKLYLSKDGLIYSSGIIDQTNEANEVDVIEGLIKIGEESLALLAKVEEIKVAGSYAEFTTKFNDAYMTFRKTKYTSMLYTVYRNFIELFVNNGVTVEEDLSKKVDTKEFSFLSTIGNAEFLPFRGITVDDKKSTANFSRLWLPLSTEPNLVRRKVLSQSKEIAKVFMTRLFENCRIFYETMCGLDWNVDTFCSDIMTSITSLEQYFKDRQYAELFKTINNSQKLFKQNAAKYYRKFIITGSESVIFNEFIHDIIETRTDSITQSRIMMQANKFLKNINQIVSGDKDTAKSIKTVINAGLTISETKTTSASSASRSSLTTSSTKTDSILSEVLKNK